MNDAGRVLHRRQAETTVHLPLAGQILVHQVHLVKIGTDVTASLASNALLWRGRPKAALAVRLLLPAAGSLAVLTLADLDALAQTSRGGTCSRTCRRRRRPCG